MGLRDKLKSINRQQQVGAKPDIAVGNNFPEKDDITAELGGTELENYGGTIFRKKYSFPLSHRHGRFCLREVHNPGPESMRQMMTVGEEFRVNCEDLLFIDTETTGLGGTGTTVFLVGVGYFAGNSFIIKQFLMRDVDEEAALLTAVRKLLGEFSLLISFNGKCFDVPVLTNRFVLNRMEQVNIREHLDLIYPARRIWSYLDSCALSNLEQQVLDVKRGDDLPGEEVPSYYFRYLQEGNSEYLQPILRHNLVDIKSLVSLLILLNRIYTDNFEIELSARELYNLARYQERKKLLHISIKNYEKAYQKASGEFINKEIEKMLSWQYKRAGKWDQALNIWEKMMKADRGKLFPYIEMAKFYEHKRKNFKQALDYTNDGLHFLKKNRILINNWRRCQQELLHRRCRLQRKLK